MRNNSEVLKEAEDVCRLMLGLHEENHNDKHPIAISPYWAKRIEKEKRMKQTFNNCMG